MLTVSQLNVPQRLLNIELDAKTGQCVHILGPNGAGKSSLLAAIAGLLPFHSGSIVIAGKTIEQHGLKGLAGLRCFQEQQHNTSFAVTVAESLQFFTGQTSVCTEVEQALEIQPFMQRSISQLSGGEQRRVNIARCLLQIWPVLMSGKGLVLLDEPTQGLDLRHQHLLCGLLAELASRGNIVLVSHHDLNLAGHYASHVWLMKDGQVIVSGKTELVLQTEQLEQVFACQLRQIRDPQGNKLFQSYLE